MARPLMQLTNYYLLHSEHYMFRPQRAIIIFKFLRFFILKVYDNRTSSNYIIPIVNKQYESNVADLVHAPDDGPLRPKHVVLRV
jgi:hypothetical protein